MDIKIQAYKFSVLGTLRSQANQWYKICLQKYFYYHKNMSGTCEFQAFHANKIF